MNYGEYAIDFSDQDKRPAKRARQSKDGHDAHRPYPSMSGPSGLQAEPDGGSESTAKKGGRKRPLSCGECRRLKLKCDRVFPCQSCCKRGCAEICPDGALTGGKGSRFILANTEQLHDKIKTMSERIRLLEEGLQVVNSQVSQNEHPLLKPDLLTIKKSAELFGIDQQVMTHDSAPGASQKQDDIARPPSTTGSSRDDDEPTARSSASLGGEGINITGLSDDLAQLSRSFPSPWSISYELDLNMRRRLRDFLPPKDEAQHLCEQARRNAFWQFNPDASETFLPNLIHSVYTTPLSALLPHRLALLLMVLAIGSVVNGHAPDRERAEKFHSLARAALCEVPVMDDTSFDAVNALFFMEWYLLMFSGNKKSVEYAWGVMGLAVKLSQSIALHRDGVRSKFIPEELDKRRTLFWDLMGTDARLALMLRRPPSINMRHVDAKQPILNGGDFNDARYHEWQHKFLSQCMIPVLDAVASAQPVPYPDILGLDSRTRNLEIPLALQMVDNDGNMPAHPLAMQQAMLSSTRHVTLLHLHRSYFIQALASNPDFTVQHPYAPSVLAVYDSCCKLIWTVRTLHSWAPELSTRFSVFWSNCFSAACALCFLVSKAPSLPIVPFALQELDRVSHLFVQVSERCSRIASYFGVLSKLISRSREHYTSWRSGAQGPADEMNDEICILVRKIVPTLANAQPVPNVAVTDPFEHAHPFLRRCLEQATAEDPCTPTGFHLTRIRGSIGSIMHPQSDVRSQIALGQPIRASSTAGSSAMWANRSRSASRSETSFTSPSSVFGADIADSSWMTWL